MLIYNDLERGRYSLAVSLSDDEGQTWRWTRHLERDPGRHRRSSWASITTRRSSRPPTARLHASYSYFLPAASVTPDAEERLPRKSIKHAHFNEAWIMEPSAQSPSDRVHR